MMIFFAQRRAMFASAACLVCSAAAAQSYSIKVLTYPGALQTYPSAENNAGMVIGYWLGSNYVSHGWLYQGGTLTNFNPPHAASTTPLGINDRGDVVGTFTDAKGNRHGFTYKGGSKRFKQVDLAGSGYTSLTAISNDGAIVGEAADSAGNQEIFTYKAGVSTVVIDNTDDPVAVATNDAGTIVGFTSAPRAREHAFTYMKGTYALVPFGGDYFTAAFAVNKRSVTAGQYVDSQGGEHGFIYTPGAKIKEFQPSGSNDAFFQGINDKGVAAGVTLDANYNALAWVFDHGKSVTFGITGDTGVGVIGINNPGQLIGDLVDANGIGGTFIAVPK